MDVQRLINRIPEVQETTACCFASSLNILASNSTGMCMFSPNQRQFSFDAQPVVY